MPHWKLLLVPLAVLVPLVAYVAGVLAAGPDRPASPSPVILEDRSDSGTREPSPGGRARHEDRGADDRKAPRGVPDDAAEDDGVDDSGADEDDGDDVQVVVPEPTQVERDDDGPEGDDDGGADDGGDRDGRDSGEGGEED